MHIHTGKTAALLGSVAMLVATACQQSTVSDETITTTAPASTSSVQPPSSPAPAAATITIDNFEYTNVTVAPGAQITVQNNDQAEHTVTSNTDGVFNVEVGPRSKATFTAPAQPGSYPFHCAYHPSMHGVLTVS